MTTVTIGVPVYNGADQLRECLDCLLTQTFRDVLIRVYDNASTDGTPEIAREFERRESRVSLIRNSHNIRAMPNFRRVIAECETTYVMWRAHDDLCSSNYVERLHAALSMSPNAKLAVPTTQTLALSGRARLSRPKPLKQHSAILDVKQLLFNSHPGWFYGLWDRDALRREFETSWAAYPHPWAFDHLVLFPFLLDREVAFAPDATFIQRLVEKSYSPKSGTKPPVGQMVALRRAFAAQCQRYIEARPFSSIERLALSAMLPFYVDKRVYKMRKIIKRTLFRDKTPAGYGSEF
ncbi:MAG: glycosyltransferase family 2 protein [Microlunatus sp.]